MKINQKVSTNMGPQDYGFGGMENYSVSMYLTKNVHVLFIFT